MELNLVQSFVGPALVTTKDAGDAVTLLQSLAGSTFDSSQLVLTACMGYQNVNETRLQELRNKHRQAVITMVEERTKGLQALRDSQGLATKLYNFKHDRKSILMETTRKTSGELSHSESGSTNADEVLISLTGDAEIDSVPDQVAKHSPPFSSIIFSLMRNLYKSNDDCLPYSVHMMFIYKSPLS